MVVQLCRPSTIATPQLVPFAVVLACARYERPRLAAACIQRMQKLRSLQSCPAALPHVGFPLENEQVPSAAPGLLVR